MNHVSVLNPRIGRSASPICWGSGSTTTPTYGLASHPARRSSLETAFMQQPPAAQDDRIWWGRDLIPRSMCQLRKARTRPEPSSMRAWGMDRVAGQSPVSRATRYDRVSPVMAAAVAGRQRTQTTPPEVGWKDPCGPWAPQIAQDSNWGAYPARLAARNIYESRIIVDGRGPSVVPSPSVRSAPTRR